MTKVDGIHRAKDLTENIWALYRGESQKRYYCGFRSIDNYFKIIKPSFNLFTGTPNSGKSSLTLEIAMRTSREHGFKYMIFSPEHSSAVNLKRLVEKYCKKPFDHMFSNRASETEVMEAIDHIHEHFLFVDKREDSPDIDWILERARACHQEFNIDGLLLDPYNEINPNRASLREDEHISLLISKIKRFNRETDTCTFLVAHPTKQIRNADGIFTVNSLYDVSGSAHWNNKADVGIIVTRDYENHTTNIRIAKIREIDVQGNVGECTIRWNNNTKCFEDFNNIGEI